MTKYEEIQFDIADKIQRGIYKADDRIPSENELMRQWKVSRITVTKALTELALGGYIYRLQGKGSFVCPLGSHIPKHSIRSAKSKASHPYRTVKKIGVLMPGHSETHGGKLLDGIIKSLPFPEYFVNTVICKSRDAENYALEQFLENGYAGVILYPVDFELYSDVILRMALAGFPLVLVDRKFPGIGCLSVTGNSALGCELAVEHLYSLSHRNIAFISETDYREQVANIRFEAFRDSMQKRGLLPLEFNNLAKDRSKAEELIKYIKSGKITAVLACNVSALTDLCESCEKENIQIPRDLSVITFDNPNAQGISCGSFFTYIDQHSYEMGRDAADILKGIINGSNTYDSKILEPKLVINSSTAIK